MKRTFKNKERQSVSAVDQDIWERIKRDPEFAKAYFKEFLDKPASIQASLLKRLIRSIH